MLCNRFLLTYILPKNQSISTSLQQQKIVILYTCRMKFKLLASTKLLNINLFLQRPLSFGVDLVLHSLSKYLNGLLLN